jgi:hypothetical protein
MRCHRTPCRTRRWNHGVRGSSHWLGSQSSGASRVAVLPGDDATARRISRTHHTLQCASYVLRCRTPGLGRGEGRPSLCRRRRLVHAIDNARASRRTCIRVRRRRLHEALHTGTMLALQLHVQQLDLPARPFGPYRPSCALRVHGTLSNDSFKMWYQ